MIVFWCKNLFLLPTSSAGKKYIDKTSMLMNQWLQDSPMKNMFSSNMPNLLEAASQRTTY